MAHFHWPLVLVAVLATQELPSGPSLEPGRVVYDEVPADGPTLVGRGPAKRFELSVDAAGPVTIAAQSYDFDAFLRVVDSSGRLLAEDDDDSFETNPRVVVALAPGSYGVIVAAPKGRSGTFEIRTELGATPPLVGLALDIVRTGFLQQSLERAIDRGDETEAGRIGVRLGNALHATRQCLAAQTVLRIARERLEAAGDESGTARADLELGRILLALGRFPNAAERFEEALLAFRSTGERADEVAALLGLGDAHASRSELDLADESYLEAFEIADRLAEPSLRAYALARQGTLALARGDHDRARELLDERLATVRKLGDRLREANARTDLGRLAIALRDCDRARTSFDEALATYTELGDSQGEARALLELGRGQIECGMVDVARKTLESALAIAREKELSELEVVALHNLGTYWEDLQRFDLAGGLYADALAKAEALQLDGEVRQLTALAGSLLVATDLPRAFEERPRLLAVLAEAEAAGDLTPVGTILTVLASLDRRTGNLVGAAEHVRRARKTYALLGWDDTALRVEEAWIHYDAGDPVRAEQAFRAIVESGASLAPVAEMLVSEGLGRLHRERGEYLDAYRRFAKRLERARGLALLDEEARAHREMGSLALELGHPETALEHLALAREYAEATGSDPLETIGVHVEFGRAYTVLQRYDDAEAEYVEARVLAEESHHPAATLFALEGLAYVRLLREDYLESLELHREALDLARSLGEARHVPLLLGNLSAVYLGLESYVAARRHALDALATAAELPAWEPSYSLEPLHTLAALSRSEGLVSEGFAYLDRAYEQIYELRGQAMLAGLGIGPDAGYWLQKLDRVYQDLSRQRERDLGRAPTGDDLVDAFRKADAARARKLLSGIVQLERGARSREAEARRDELADLYKEWTTLAALRRRALRDPDSSEDTDALRRRVEALRRRIDTLELALAQISPRDAGLVAHEGAHPDALRRSALGPGRALILYAEGELELYAYVLTQDTLSVHKLGARGSFEERAERYVDMLGNRRALGTPAEIARLGGALYAELCARPLKALESPPEHLIVVPTPALAGLPFGALVAEGPVDARAFDQLSFLADRCMVTYGPAGSVLVHIAERGPSMRDGKVLVLADPTYGSDGTDGAVEASSGTLASIRSSSGLGPLPRLVQSRAEAFSVAEPIVRSSEPGALARLEALRSERSGALEVSAIDLFVGADASPARLLEGSLRPYSWIHLAVHGRVGRGSPNETGVVLAREASGLGFVTVADILELDLRAELVVLSACDTARGTLRDGEGIESMASAFLHAGAHNVIASLWQVDDAVTANTMSAFYARVLGSHDATSAALHAAQTSVREIGGGSSARGANPVAADPLAIDPKHPYFWAAFVHIGLPAR